MDWRPEADIDRKDAVMHLVVFAFTGGLFGFASFCVFHNVDLDKIAEAP